MQTVPDRDVPLTAAAYGERYGIHAALVVAAIRDGVIPGERRGRVWYTDSTPPPAALVPARHEASDTRTGRTDAPSAADLPLVVRYTSPMYVNVLMGVIAAFIAVALASFAASWDVRELRGVGTRAAVLWLLWTRHRWARRAVYLWAGLLALGGAAGLATSAVGVPPVPIAVAVPMFSAFVVAGLFYLASVHRYIRVEPEHAAGVPTLEDIAREARLD